MFGIGKYKFWLIKNDDMQVYFFLFKSILLNIDIIKLLCIQSSVHIYTYISNQCYECRSLKVSISKKEGLGNYFILNRFYFIDITILLLYSYSHIM